MLQIKNSNFKRVGMLALLGFLTSAGVGLIKSAPIHAIECANGSVSCVSVEFGEPVGDRTLHPSSNIYSATQFYLPVAVNIGHAEGYAVDYSIKVYGSGNALTDANGGSGAIPSILQNTSYNDLGKNGSEWGLRWNLGDQVSDAYADYRPVPESIDDPAAAIITDGKVDKATKSLSKQLTLGFAVAVGSDQASGSYANTITVAVVASPKDARNLFDISTMQEMTPEICQNTTTPTTKTISTSSNINVTTNGADYTTAIDTTGQYQDNGAYVPQKELTDTRDGKKYTIRKLADGNCWMVSNLEFDFVPTASKNTSTGSTPSSAFSTNGTDKVTESAIVLTNKDTDLNSMREWTPEISAKAYGEAGTVYKTQRNAGKGDGTEGAASATTAVPWGKDGTDGLRSFSSAAGYPSALYSTKTSSDPAFSVSNTGKPWQRFGNLYNWTAATLGSGTKVAADDQNAADSICPKGWKLPYNSGNDSFLNLITTTYGIASSSAGANQMANFPLNFLRTGFYDGDGRVSYRTTHGGWWSATSYPSASSSSAYYLYTTTSTVYAPAGSGRGVGRAIRCVAQ